MPTIILLVGPLLEAGKKSFRRYWWKLEKSFFLRIISKANEVLFTLDL